MCGIVGVLNLTERPPVSETTLVKMLSAIQHRGPDGFGIYRDDQVGLGSTRLAIIDLLGGDQPIANEDGTLWIVFNGEIFNHVELRPQLEARGHRFASQSDTEVILHLYEDLGPKCLQHLNGQFAFAIWDTQQRQLFLARDRLGVRPLYYTADARTLVFGSEIKSLFNHPNVHPAINRTAIEEIFTFWSTLSPHTCFNKISDVPPGHYLIAQDGHIKIESYWELDFTVAQDTNRSPQDYVDELASLLIDATCIRLRADVPVGAYLSGGLDSSLTTAIIRKYTNARLDTFSIAFKDNPEYDESEFQQCAAEFLGTNHHVVECTHRDIGDAFPKVIWHTETPILRTAPVPMFLLSQLVHNYGFKVVVTGEGADEFLAGYDIFKEMQVRRFWAKYPESKIRPLLLQKMYPEIPGLSNHNPAYLNAFFKQGLADTHSPYYSHIIRWNNTARARRFLKHNSTSSLKMPDLPAAFFSWSPLAQAQYLETSIFLSQYLLSSQGDRPAMAHSVEGRFPFLDYRVVEFCNRLPPNLKLHGMNEKWLLRQVARKLLPSEIWQRRKRPYRAPIHRSFFNPSPDYVWDAFSSDRLKASYLFNIDAVHQLVRKAQTSPRLSEFEEMALVGILSTQLVHQQFIESPQKPITEMNQLKKVVDRVRE